MAQFVLRSLSLPCLSVPAGRLIRTLALVVMGLAVSAAASAQTFWGLTTDHRLVRFSRQAPGVLLASLPITGVPPGEHIVSIEVLTFEGTLIGYTDYGRVFELDRQTGAATPLYGGQLRPPLFYVGSGFTDAGASMEFLSNSADLFFIQKGDGAHTGPFRLTTQGDIAALAWHWAGAATRVVINSTFDTLQRFDFDGLVGTFTPIGPLGVDVHLECGMDFDARTGALYAALTVLGSPGLYTIDPATGHATLIGAIASPPITSLTVDGQGAPLLSPAGVTEIEASTTLQFQVQRTGDTTVASEYLVQTGSVSTPAATAGQDYVAKSEVLTFAPGETIKSVSVMLLDDGVREPQEGFFLSVSENVPGGFVTQAPITIVDDDNAPPVLTVTQPVGGVATVSTSTLTFTGTVTDEDSGFTVQLFAPGDHTPLQTSTSAAWTFPNVALSPGLNTFTIVATDQYGKTDGESITVVVSAPAPQTFVFAEGATGSFFSTDLLFANPNFVDVPVHIDFLRQDGVVIAHDLTLPASQRTTLRVDEIPGLEETATAAIATADSYPIVVERTTRWGAGGYGAATEKASSGFSTTWLFAEGSQGFFYTYLLLVNPASTENEVTVRFLREGEAPVVRTYTVAPRQRLTIDAGAIPDLVDRSFGTEVTFAQPGAAERAMYFGLTPLWNGGHGAAGVTAPATEWFLAEGATGTWFDTFLLLANPGAADATVTLTYLPSIGAPVTRTKVVPANARLTVNIEIEDPAFAHAALAVRVNASSPIVVERAQYWPYDGRQWYEAHASFGQTAAATHWGLAEGRMGGVEGYQTFILIANPQSTDASLTVRFLREGAPPLTKAFSVPALSRYGIAVGSEQVPEITQGAFGVEIFSTEPIMVERSLYSSPAGALWSAGTNATATRLP